tara:strand:- start:509 stop:1342 length:834 start_codon:yes stop_codon:yes gene_type:complete
MKYLKGLIDIIYFITYLFRDRKNSIRILIYHDIKTKIQKELFQNQINALSKKYDFISPKEFEDIIKKGKVKGKKILLSFDDGFKSNRIVAESILNKYGIKALFFIISDFFDLNTHSLTYNKIIKNIYPNGPKLDELSEPMNRDDIQFLINTGHSIGCHTATHKMLSKIIETSELNKELIQSKDHLEKTFNIKIKHIAFPFGTFKSIDMKSLKVLTKNYQFVHSGLRGNNIKNHQLLFRDASNPEMKITRLKAFLLGNADFIYKNKFKTFKSFLIDTI